MTESPSQVQMRPVNRRGRRIRYFERLSTTADVIEEEENEEANDEFDLDVRECEEIAEEIMNNAIPITAFDSTEIDDRTGDRNIDRFELRVINMDSLSSGREGQTRETRQWTQVVERES